MLFPMPMPMPTFAHLCLYPPMATYANPCLPYAYLCLPMRVYAYLCLPMPTYAYLCLPMPNYAYLCLPVPTYAYLCAPMPSGTLLEMGLGMPRGTILESSRTPFRGWEKQVLARPGFEARANSQWCFGDSWGCHSGDQAAPF